MAGKNTYEKLERQVDNIHKQLNDLKEYQTHSDTLFENLKAAIVIYEPDTKIVYSNHMAETLFGFSKKKLYGKKASDQNWQFLYENGNRIPPENFPVNRVLKTKKPLKDLIFGILQPDQDSTVWVLANAVPLFDDRGSVIQVILNFSDITKRKHTEAELKQSKEQYRELVENINEVIYSINTDQVISYISPVVKSVTGFDRQELIGRKLIDLVYPGDQPHLSKLMEQVLAGGSEHVDLRILHQSNKIIWIRASGRPIYSNNVIKGIQGVFTDITEKKELEGLLRHSQKMEAIGTLAGGIAHDFNNILASIIGYTELALLKNEKGDQWQDMLKQVLKSGNRAKDLVKQILSYARQTEVQTKPVDIRHIAEEMMTLLRATLPSSIKLQHHFKKDTLIEADPSQMHQVLMNLCTNSIDATKEKGGTIEAFSEKVTLTPDFIEQYDLMASNHYLKLTVKDSGCGIPAGIQERIFDPYFTTKKSGSGTGLGLSMVHGIVRSYGGAILVNSQINKGSTFSVYIPLLEEKRSTGDIPDNQTMLSGNERILFIDDEQSIIEISRQFFEMLGYAIETKTDPVAALNLFRNNPDAFDLVITDMNMEVLTGDELAVEMLAIRPEIPIILATGFSERISEEKAKQIGIRTFFIKPVQFNELARIVRNVLDKK